MRKNFETFRTDIDYDFDKICISGLLKDLENHSQNFFFGIPNPREFNWRGLRNTAPPLPYKNTLPLGFQKPISVGKDLLSIKLTKANIEYEDILI